MTVNDGTFFVYKQFELEDNNLERDSWVGTRMSFRAMQEMCWLTTTPPSCNHPARLGEEIEVPDGVSCFSGVGRPSRRILDPVSQVLMDDIWVQNLEGWVHAGLVAGSSVARWILLLDMLAWSVLHSAPRGVETHRSVFLRGQDCCFRCALEWTKSRRKGRVLGLIL